MEKFIISFKGKSIEVEVERITATGGSISINKPAVSSNASVIQQPRNTAIIPDSHAGAQTIAAPMPGKVLTIHVHCGDQVRRGEVLLVLEAMKMENEIMAPADGRVLEIHATVGQSVTTGDHLMVIA
jgi:biotin carboxyl carrier protein